MITLQCANILIALYSKDLGLGLVCSIASS